VKASAAEGVIGPKTADFLAAVLRRVETAARMSAGRQLAVLAAACRELERLASIEEAISDPASFSRHLGPSLCMH
jgi:hypothetical protein